MDQKYPQQNYIYTGSRPERNLGDSSLESDSSIIDFDDEEDIVNEDDLIMTENFFEIPKERDIPCINIPFNDKEISPQNKQGMMFCSATKDTENECLRKNSNNKNENFSIKKNFNFINENNRYNINKLFKKNCHFFTSLQNDDDESDEEEEIVDNEITVNFNNGFNVENNEIMKNKINNNSTDKFKKEAQFEVIIEPNVSNMDSISEISIRNINKINAMNRYENETSDKEKEKEKEIELDNENKYVMENTLAKENELEENIKRIIENINNNKNEWNKNKIEYSEINIGNKDNNGEDYFIENKENYVHNGLFDKEIKLNSGDNKDSSNSKFLEKNNKNKIINIDRDINVNLNNIFFELKTSKKSNDINFSKSKSYKSYKSSSMKRKRGRKIFNLSKKYKIFQNFLSVGIDTSGLYTLDDTMKSLILNPKITYNYPLNNLEKDLE